MACPEMKELEASYAGFSDRRQVTSRPLHERRKASTGGPRAGLARLAYLMQMHRLNCPKCRVLP